MYRVNFSEERINHQERALLLALHRGARLWRLAFWTLALVALLLGWLVAGLADRLRETRASLDAAHEELHQARLAQRCERPTYFAYLPD